LLGIDQVVFDDLRLSRSGYGLGFSMPPPPTVPTNFPSAKTNIFDVECRGTDPLDLITVQRAADCPLAWASRMVE
jgi:hypothetical protein